MHNLIVTAHHDAHETSESTTHTLTREFHLWTDAVTAYHAVSASYMPNAEGVNVSANPEGTYLRTFVLGEARTGDVSIELFRA